jgi:hypothetical protein
MCLVIPTPPTIRCSRDRFKVRWVHARWVVAKVVELKNIRDRADPVLVGPAMGVDLSAAAKAEPAIAPRMPRTHPLGAPGSTKPLIDWFNVAEEAIHRPVANLLPRNLIST